MNTTYKMLSAAKSITPGFLRAFVRSRFSFTKFDIARLIEGDENALRTGEDFPTSSVRLGIIKDGKFVHRHYIAACRAQKVSYRVLDILEDDWVSEIEKSNCDAFLVWPGSSGTAVKSAFDMRLKILEEDMGRIIFPTWKECWLTEYKPRLRDWLQVHGIPHPKTWVFYKEEEAQEFARSFCFEDGAVARKLVVKTATGAAGCGVWIVSNRTDLLRLAKKFFRNGVQIRAFEPWDRARGYLFAQEYIPQVEEWRMVRIGDSFFGHRKDVGKDGKHSGSHACSYLTPTKAMLDLLKRVTDEGGFRSMDVDVFVAPSGEMWVNECQTTFGCSVATTQMKIDGVEGRYLYQDNKWVFDPGAYCAHHCCDLRVQYLLDILKEKKSING